MKSINYSLVGLLFTDNFIVLLCTVLVIKQNLKKSVFFSQFGKNVLGEQRLNQTVPQQSSNRNIKHKKNRKLT